MSRDGVITLLGRLHTYQDIVSLAYHNGEIVKDEDNARGIDHLQQHKVLTPRSQDAYTLHSSLRRFLDASLNIERLYRIGSDIGAAFEQMEQLAESLSTAFHDGRIEDRERLEDGMYEAIYDISDSLSNDLAHLRALVENRFAAVSTLAEKRKQNAYYIGRTEKIVEAIELFTLSDFGERIQTLSPYANVEPMFTSQLLDRLPSFRQNLLDILAILQAYLFEFRSIEARTKRVRSMWLFMERHPLYEIKEWDEEPHPPEWLKKASATEVKASPWVRDPVYTDDLVNLARETPPAVVRLAVVRERGSLVIEDEEIVELVPKRYQQAISRMLMTCKETGEIQSAFGWFRGHPDQMEGLTPQLWTQCVLEELYRPKAGEMGLLLNVDESPDGVFDGNVIVRDVLVSVAAR